MRGGSALVRALVRALGPALGRALVAASLALGAACARGPKFPPPPRDSTIVSPDSAEPPPAAPRSVTLRVENHNRADLTIYISRGAVRTRLGLVNASTTGNLAIPSDYVNDMGGFQLIADPLGGRSPLTTETVVVRSGQRVVWTIESSFSRSSLGIY